jgi:large subunit ribosomal protein L5
VAEDQGKKKAKAPKGDAKKEAKKEEAPKEKPRRELKPKVPSELEKRYREVSVPALMKEFGYTNPMQVPRLEKIVINSCLKEALQDTKILDTAASEIAAITGQRPAITKSKKSISNFKLRKGQSLGARVTLRGKTMYEFLSRLVNVALPRVRDFKGVPSKSFDGRGNYTLGLTDQTIFPEINFDKVQRVTGMNVTFVTSASTDAEGMALLKNLGMPFRSAEGALR